jgi:tRNA uridine 5-carboxymethylaminomethyl modification enzyme
MEIHIGDKIWWRKKGESAHGITEDLINAGLKLKNENRNASKSGWTFFGLFKMNEEKGDAKPDKFSYSDLTRL